MLSDLKIEKDLYRLIKLLINEYDAFFPAFYDSL
jgi:hypothetical protein